MARITNRQEARAWQDEYDGGAPKLGDVAPDFELSDIGGNKTVRLSDYRGSQPVGLIFGSFT